MNYIAQKTPKRREVSLDIARGVAVLLMILAHVVYFLHNESNPFLISLQRVGDTVAFVMFLLISGASTFLNIKGITSISSFKSKSTKRLFILLGGYYITAFASYLHHINFANPEWPLEIIKILTFQTVPGFTEFMIPFIFINILTIFVPKYIYILGKNHNSSLSLGLILYAAGILLYQIQLPEPLVQYKALFSGSDGHIRFPIFYYSIIFFLGLNLGYELSKDISLNEKRKYLFKNLLFSTLIFIGGIIAQNFVELDLFYRWPPTPFFLSAGVMFTFLVLFLIIRRSSIYEISWIYRLSNGLGRSSLQFFVIHIVILQIYDQNIRVQTDSLFLVLIGLVLMILLCSMIIGILKSLNTEKQQDQSRFNNKSVKKKKVNNSQVIILITVLTAVLLVAFQNTVSGKEFYEKRTEKIKGEAIVKKDTTPVWWNYDYTFYKRITVSNNAAYSNIEIGDLVTVKVDHADLVKNNKSKIDGSDLKIVYLKNSIYQELPAEINSPNSTETVLTFKTIDRILPKVSNRNFYLYYGNKLATASVKNTDKKDNLPTTIVSLSSEKKGILSVGLNKYWVLKEDKIAKTDRLKITVDVASQGLNNQLSDRLNYKILGTNFEGQLIKRSSTQYETEVDVNSLNPGVYQIQAIGQSQQEQILSPKESFVVSYPLYVTWSMDWEGYDVRDDFLADMDRIANQYKIPISHFFNARLFIGINKARAVQLANWIKERQSSRGDSLGLHLHMFYDMVQAAGVDPYKMGGTDYFGNSITPGDRPRWGSVSQGGYDTLTSSFSYDELNKIIQWSLNQFKANGMSTPIGFRAGGWFTDIENLYSIEDTGLLYDSSGRTRFTWGSKNATGEWDLASTTQPYRPSTTNQNSPNPAPNFSIWEIPNNGADSYTFSAEQMIQRFNDNLPTNYLNEKRVVTFLSHPHWFNVDKPKLDKLFTHVEQYSNKADRGPVVYVNLDEVYKIWTDK